MIDNIRMPIVRELFPEGNKLVYSGWGNKNLPFYVSDTNDMFVLYGDGFLQVKHRLERGKTLLFVQSKMSVFIADDVKIYCDDEYPLLGFEYER